MDIPVIETNRLLLRGWQDVDQLAFAELNANPDFVRFLGNGEALTRNDSWQLMTSFMGHWALKGFGFWAVEEKASHKFVGRVGLWQPPGWPGVELGWGIAPEYWHIGYGYEAAQAAMYWGFANLEAEKFISLINPNNIASITLAERLGANLAYQDVIQDRLCQVYEVARPEMVGVGSEAEAAVR